MSCNHELLLDYLYDELPAAERPAFENHLESCAACREELAALGGTRRALATWSPPDPGLWLVSGQELFRRSWLTVHPAAALAAAAVLVLAIATAVARVEIRYDSSGFVVRTGAPAEAPAAVAGGTAVPAALTSEEWRTRLQTLDTRLRQLEGAARPVTAAAVDVNDVPGAAPGSERTRRMDDAELLRAVRRIIAESEARQQRELALRVAQMVRDVDAMRAGDLARIEQGLRQIQGLTDAELIRHRDTLNHLLRVTQR